MGDNVHPCAISPRRISLTWGAGGANAYMNHIDVTFDHWHIDLERTDRMVRLDDRRNTERGCCSYRAVSSRCLRHVNTLTQRPKTPAEELLSKVRGMTDEEKAAKEKEENDVLSNAILNHQTNSIEQVLVLEANKVASCRVQTWLTLHCDSEACQLIRAAYLQ